VLVQFAEGAGTLTLIREACVDQVALDRLELRRVQAPDIEDIFAGLLQGVVLKSDVRRVLDDNGVAQCLVVPIREQRAELRVHPQQLVPECAAVPELGHVVDHGIGAVLHLVPRQLRVRADLWIWGRGACRDLDAGSHPELELSGQGASTIATPDTSPSKVSRQKRHASAPRAAASCSRR
jgi:hypothetical protein